jgi:hypothetical protein
MARCDWETDKLALAMMHTLYKIHSDSRLNPDMSLVPDIKDDGFVDELCEEIKIGDIMEDAIIYKKDIPYYNEIPEKIIKSIKKFYDVSEYLYKVSLHSNDIKWCVYRSGSKWENFNIGHTRILPIYFSTTTSLDFASSWKADRNVLFKIITSFNTKVIVLEDIYNSGIYYEQGESEFEITFPPGILTIVSKEHITINNSLRELITCDFIEFSREQSLKYLDKMKYF